jgi:hypothetical protein
MNASSESGLCAIVISRVCEVVGCGSAGVEGVALTAVFLILSTVAAAGVPAGCVPWGKF